MRKKKPQTEVFGTTEIFMEDSPFSLEAGTFDELPPLEGCSCYSFMRDKPSLPIKQIFLYLYLWELDAFSRSDNVAENTLSLQV